MFHMIAPEFKIKKHKNLQRTRVVNVPVDTPVLWHGTAYHQYGGHGALAIVRMKTNDDSSTQILLEMVYGFGTVWEVSPSEIVYPVKIKKVVLEPMNV